MSGGIGSLSDDTLMGQLRAAGFGGSGPAGALPVAPPAVSDLSNDDLLRQLQGARAPAPTAQPRRDAGPSFDDRFAGSPLSSETDISSGLGAGLRAAADERLVGKPSAATPFLAALYRSGNAVALNAPRNLAALAATELGLNKRSFQENYDLAKDQEEAFARQAPRSAVAGTVAGIGAGALALPALGPAKFLGQVGQAAVTGAGYGALGEFLDTKDLGSAAGAGAIGGAIGAAAVPVVSYVGKAAQAMAPWVQKGISFTNARGEYTPEAKAALSRAGIHPDLVPRRQLDDAIAATFANKGVSEASAREAAAAEFAIPLSRGQATGDEAAQRFEAAAASGARGKRAETVAQEFDARQRAAIDAARQRIDTSAGRGIGLDDPVQAAETIADQARGLVTRSTLDADLAQRGADDALSRLRGPAPLDPLDAGAAVAQGLRGEAALAKGRYRAGYDDLAALDGEFHPRVFDGLGSRIERRLGADLPLDPVLTPAATRAMADLGDARGILRLQDGQGATAQQVELLRKRMGTLYPSTAQNPTDRMALGRIRSAFDEEMQAAAETGQFGPRQGGARPDAGTYRAAQRLMEEAAGRGERISADDALRLIAQRAADGVPEASALDGLSGGAVGRQREPEGLLAFLGRRGGIALDDDARAADYGRIQTGFGPLGRKNGRSIEDFRDELAAEGFIRPDDATGVISRRIGDELHDLIGLERNGHRVTRLSDTSRGLAAPDVGGRLADDSAAYAERLGAFTRQVETDLRAAGLRSQDIDPAALRDASERLMRRQADDGAEAYEAAVMARGSDDGARAARIANDEVPFPQTGEGIGPARSEALPVATPEGERYAETGRLARSLFQDYKAKFAPQGAGDDVGLAMRRIVDRDAEPVEVSRMLYSGNPGLNIRIADRVKSVVGADSDAWAAHQQGYLSSIINGRDMSPQAISARIEDALSGPRRGLTSRVLTEDQVSGLRFFQGATAQARLTRDGVPEWVATLGRTDFDPNSVMSNLFGAGVPGARPGSAAYASSLKKFVGEDSTEWSGLRQAAWRRLTGSDDGRSSLGPEAMADRIMKFTKGAGSGLAKQMFTPSELEQYPIRLDHMRRSLRRRDSGGTRLT